MLALRKETQKGCQGDGVIDNISIPDLPTYGGEPLTFSAMVKTEGLTGGANLGIIYYNGYGESISTLDSGESFTYTYDGANNLTGVTDQGSHNYSWDYDGAGRITGSTDATGYNLDYQWDKSHNLTGVTGTNTTSYQYGSTNRLLSVTLPDSSNIYYYYDETGKVFQVKYPGDNHYRNIYYYPNSWCRQVQDNAFPAQSYYFNYSYYDNGNISSISSWDGTDNYTYDSNGRLNSWTHIPTSGSTTQQNYQYDAAGNLTVKGSSSYSYNRANQISNTGFSCDNNGNLTSDTTYNLSSGKL